MYFTLTTTNVKAGSTFAYTLSGVTAADVAGPLTGIATTDASGKAIIAVTLVNDNLTEGAETLTLSAAGKTGSVTINDTSVAAPLPVANAEAFTAAHAAAVAAEAAATAAAATVTKAAADKADADKKASDAQTKASLTDAAALKTSSDTAATTAAKAVADNTAAQALVTTSQTNYDNAVAAGDVAAVSNTSAVLAINKSRADTATKAVATTAAAAKTALDAANSAAADDQAAADAATAATSARVALDKAIAAASPLTAAATAAAAADAIAAAAYKAAALATASTADDAAGNAAPGMAAALGTQAAADARMVSEAADALAAADKLLADAAAEKANGATAQAALAKYTAAASQYDTDLAAYNTADADATTAINAVSSSATATTAYNKSVTEQSAAATLVASAAAKSEAAKAFKAAADATKATTDDAAATTAVTAANSNTISAAKAKADADTQVATQKAKISDYDAKTFNLTKGLDNLVGTAGDDTFSGSRDKEASNDLNTASNIDTVDGGAGTGDKFKLSSTLDLATTDLPIISNIEILEITGAKSVVLDTTGISGLTTLTINKAGTGTDTSTTPTTTIYSTVKASSTTSVNISGSTDKIEVKGGNNVTVSDSTVDKNITVSTGAVTGNAVGAISVTDTNQGSGDIKIDGGTSVTVTATSNTKTGNINVADKKAASGAVSVTQNLNDDGTGFDNSTQTITVKGGSTITVTSNATSTAKAVDASGGLKASAIAISSDGKTTDVNVNQTSTVTTFTKAEIPVVKESSVVTFGAMKSGEALVINGLTFTASKDLTAAQTAAAFANLTTADIQSTGGPVANGTYSGTFNTAVWTSGAANGNVVTFTASDEDQGDLTFSGTATTNDSNARTPTQAKTTGTRKVDKSTSGNQIELGAVRIDDAATATIKTVSIDGYKSADIGVTGNDLNALTTLSLANSAGQANVATSATALTLNLNKVKNAVDISTNSNGVVSLKLNATTADSAFVLTAKGVKDLTVDGTKSVDLTGSTLDALETVVVSGSAGLNLKGISASKSVNTTATTGAVTATIDASTASYTGGAGNDNLSLKADVVSKGISLGAGDDTLILRAGSSTVPTVIVEGGDGTDTLSMTTASAVSFSNDTALASKLTSFEKLTISDKAGTNDSTTDTVTVGADKLGFTYITTSGTNTGSNSAKDTLVLNNLASGSTVVLTATGSIKVAVKDAATGTADSVNVIGSYNGATDAGTFTADNVESIKITTKDTDTTSTGATVDALSLTLVATSAKTLTADGNAPLNLTNTGNAKLETVDASNLAGKLTFVSANTTTAATIKGGAGGDDITASSTGGQADQLYGNGGNDSLTAGNGLTQMWGGTGNDTFKISVASANVNSASTIMDLSTGDVIQITGANVFKQAKISLDPAGNPNLVSYADAAIASIGEGEMAWFQYNGNTYIVSENNTADGHADGSTFINGQDYIVKIVGTAIDLSTASYNSTSNKLEIS